jgi:hypothetical protein
MEDYCGVEDDCSNGKEDCSKGKEDRKRPQQAPVHPSLPSPAARRFASASVPPTSMPMNTLGS